MAQWPKEVEETLKNLPDHPGVYLMRDAQDTIIYVGKAISLKRRVRQYFQSTQKHGAKVRAMVAKIARIEYILADGELEALILECNLIKRYRPHYNILLKDDKQYPYVRINLKEPYPRVEIARRIADDGARYFGPYIGAHSLRDVLNTLKKTFPIRTCKKAIVPGMRPERPCLNYQIGACMAPCAGLVTPEEYREVIDQVILFLSGKYEDIVSGLQEKMADAASKMEYERAAIYRDRIAMIDRVMQRQKAISTGLEDRDVLALAEEGPLGVVQVTNIRAGKMIGSQHYPVNPPLEAGPGEILADFITQTYGEDTFIPREILVASPLPSPEVYEQWLSEKRGSRVYVLCPQRGEKKRLVELTQDNAKERLRRILQKEQVEHQRTIGAMEDLQKILHLPKVPWRIEGYDNSNIQGTNPVSVMVVAEGGKAKPKAYRRFKVKTVEGPNDYETMREVLTRRFTHGFAELQKRREEGIPDDAPGGKFLPLPDLVLIDGGKGQLGIALEVWEELGLDIPVLGLAERYEEVYLPGRSDPVVLPRNSLALQLLQRVRDEAHRFGITFHRSLRAKSMVQSALEQLPQVGPARRRALFAHFGTVSAMEKATLEEICAVPGMNRPAAQALYAHFHGEQAEKANETEQ